MNLPTPQVHYLWAPTPKQSEFLDCTASEVCYGGSAGGGKSAASIAMPLRWIKNPRFRCLFLRREAKYLADALDKSKALYPRFGAKLVQSPKTIWTFPSGATVWLNHMEHESDIANYDSLEFHLVLLEELTHFSQKQFLGIKARIRGTDRSLPRWVRATTNPGGEGHEWVFSRYAPWLDPRCPVRAKPGELLWYDGDQIVPAYTSGSLSRTFIPARLSDNPYITEDYRAQLKQLDPVRRAQLLDGDWLKKPVPKDYWDRDKVTHVDSTPMDVVTRVRCWDFGATEDGDYTVGAKMAITRQGVIVLEHVIRFRGAPAKVHAEFSRIVTEDRQHDSRMTQVIPQDPGQAGVDQIRSFTNENPGIPIRARRPTGDKLTRFGPASARAVSGLLVVVRGSWNHDLHDELESVPEQAHDDQMDCVSDGVAVLTGAEYVAPRPRTVGQSRGAVWG